MPDVPRARDGRPYVVPPWGGRPVLYTRASRLASTVDDTAGLDMWHQHLIARGLSDNPWLLSKVRETYQPTERGYDWQAMSGVCATIRRLAGGEDKSEYGTLLHSLTERLDTGRPLGDDLTDDALPDLLAYEYRTENIRHHEVEQFMVCDELRAAGTPDRRSFLSNEVLPTAELFSGHCITDVKTGKVEGKDVAFAIQLATYSRSMFYRCTHPVEGKPSKEQCAAYADFHERRPANVSLDWGVVISVPAKQGRCDLYWVDLQTGWELAKLAHDIRQRRTVKAVSPFFLA